MKHFIDLTEWSSEDMHDLLDLALKLKAEWRAGGNQPVLKNKVLGLIFQKPSLRTRVSFEVGMQQLGGTSISLGPGEIGLGKRESIADVSRALSRYVNIIMARVFEHEHVVELARWSSVPVINGLTDEQHPCQALTDIMTIYEHCGFNDKLTIAYVGDGNNVAGSLLQAAAHFGINFRIATPPGYELPEMFIDSAAEIGAQNGITIEMYHDPRLAIKGADVIYTDTWVSMGQENETERRVRDLQPYQVNAELMHYARTDAIVMHCLPAHRGWEITDEVADGPQSVIFDQAENRLHAQKAILVTLLKGE